MSSGSLIRKVDPSPGTESTEALPPWASATAATIDTTTIMIRTKFSAIRIAISGQLSTTLHHDAVAAGCVTYFKKPYSPMALVAEIKHWLLERARQSQ